MNFLKEAAKDVVANPARVLRAFDGGQGDVVYVGESTDWVVKRIGDEIGAVTAKHGLPLQREATPLFFRNKILHFGSLYNLAKGLSPGLSSSSNIIVGNVYHGDLHGSDRSLADALKIVVDGRAMVDRIVLSTSIMEKRMLSWGVERNKLVRIHIGYDAHSFVPLDPAKREELRSKLNLPARTLLVGSFQKDGNGWGEGNEPKLIKGPDLFVDTLIRLKKDFPVHCILTGPSRGYVKNRLTEAGVPFTHEQGASTKRLNELYNILDLCLVSSREEGGPIALMESMACGVPLVSTPVGMAVDIIRHGENALVASAVDVEEIYKECKRVFEDDALNRKLRANGPASVRHLGWDRLSLEYLKLYRELLEQRRTR